MKKRLFSLVIATVMVASLLIGCGKKDTNEDENKNPSNVEETEITEEPENKVDLKDIPEMSEDGENMGTIGYYYFDNDIAYFNDASPIDDYYYSVKIPDCTEIGIAHSLGKTNMVSSIGDKDLIVVFGEHEYNNYKKLSKITKEKIQESIPTNEIFEYNEDGNMEYLIYDSKSESAYGYNVRIKDNEKNIYYRFLVATQYDENGELEYNQSELYEVAKSIAIIKDENILKNLKKNNK